MIDPLSKLAADALAHVEERKAQEALGLWLETAHGELAGDAGDEAFAKRRSPRRLGPSSKHSSERAQPSTAQPFRTSTSRRCSLGTGPRANSSSRSSSP